MMAVGTGRDGVIHSDGASDGYHRCVQTLLSDVLAGGPHHLGLIHKILIVVGLLLVAAFIVSRIIYLRRHRPPRDGRRP
jgi:hypothetical protein